jgi:cytochrome c-type biogenesis protein CcmH/NrfG
LLSCSILGKSAFLLEDHAQAETAYRRAIDINPAALLAWKGLAETYSSNAENTKLLEANEQLVCCCNAFASYEAVRIR